MLFMKTNPLLSTNTKLENAIEVIDQLLVKIPSEYDTLLDMRLTLMSRTEPGVCIKSYFKLKRQLSDWHLSSLELIKDALEISIQIEITLLEKDERQRTCLGLNESTDISTYCEEKMKSVARSFKENKDIILAFRWTES